MSFSRNYKATETTQQYVSSVARLKGMDWIDIVIMEEEEKEEEQELKRQSQIRKCVDERKVLIAKGMYEPEEGEEYEE